jgi:hypothetical protein
MRMPVRVCVCVFELWVESEVDIREYSEPGSVSRYVRTVSADSVVGRTRMMRRRERSGEKAWIGSGLWRWRAVRIMERLSGVNMVGSSRF